VLVGDRTEAAEARAGSDAVVLEANVDDLDPRLWPEVLTRLLAAGASDAWLVPILMKKGRPAHVLSVLADLDRAAELRALVFALTSTLGVRSHPVEKHALPRLWVQVDVAGGPVEVKVGHGDGAVLQVSAEFESVARRAQALGLSQQDVLARTLAAAAAAGLTPGAPLPPPAPSSRRE
jgi:uncharacterized protein (DUF111 family)